MPGNERIIERGRIEVNGPRDSRHRFGACCATHAGFTPMHSLVLLSLERCCGTRTRRRILLRLGFVFFGLPGAIAWGDAPRVPRWAVAALPSGDEFSLEIAADDASRVRGYMFREKVGEREGMLFIFEAAGRHSFWMKNCKVPLDIIWLDEAFRVVQIAPDLPPCPTEGDCPFATPLQPARYVLELAGGVAKRQGLKRSDQVVILSEPPLR